MSNCGSEIASNPGSSLGTTAAAIGGANNHSPSSVPPIGQMIKLLYGQFEKKAGCRASWILVLDHFAKALVIFYLKRLMCKCDHFLIVSSVLK